MVSIIIPARNEEKVIGACLSSLSRLKYPNYEVLIIDDGSTDRTADIARDYPFARVISIDGLGPSAARNRAVLESHGRWLAFTDADCIVSPDWLDFLMAVLDPEKDKLIGVGGLQQPVDDDPPFARLVHSFLLSLGFVSEYIRHDQNAVPTDHNPTCNALLLKKPVVEAGGFWEGLWPCEDVEIDLRLRRSGYQLMFTPKAVVHHHRPDTWRSFARMMWNYGSGHAQLVKHYGPFRLLHFLMPLSLLLLVGWFVLLALSPFAAGITAAAVAGIILLYFMVKTGPKEALLMTGWLLPTAVIKWQMGFFKGLFSTIPPPPLSPLADDSSD